MKVLMDFLVISLLLCLGILGLFFIIAYLNGLSVLLNTPYIFILFFIFFMSAYLTTLLFIFFEKPIENLLQFIVIFGVLFYFLSNESLCLYIKYVAYSKYDKKVYPILQTHMFSEFSDPHAQFKKEGKAYIWSFKENDFVLYY